MSGKGSMVLKIFHWQCHEFLPEMSGYWLVTTQFDQIIECKIVISRNHCFYWTSFMWDTTGNWIVISLCKTFYVWTKINSFSNFIGVHCLGWNRVIYKENIRLKIYQTQYKIYTQLQIVFFFTFLFNPLWHYARRFRIPIQQYCYRSFLRGFMIGSL